MEIRGASAQDLAGVLQLLARAKLVTEDVDSELRDFFVALDRGELIGAIGLEPHGTLGLLRSLVVAPAVGGRGFGQALTQHLVAEAERRNLEELYLLTETARVFFERLGFDPVERASVPEPIQRTKQYSSACPASATVMRRSLRS